MLYPSSIHTLPCNSYPQMQHSKISITLINNFNYENKTISFLWKFETVFTEGLVTFWRKIWSWKGKRKLFSNVCPQSFDLHQNLSAGKGWALAKKKKLLKAYFKICQKDAICFITSLEVECCFVWCQSNLPLQHSIVHVALPWAAWLLWKMIKGNFQIPEGKKHLKKPRQNSWVHLSSTSHSKILKML